MVEGEDLPGPGPQVFPQGPLSGQGLIQGAGETVVLQRRATTGSVPGTMQLDRGRAPAHRAPPGWGTVCRVTAGPTRMHGTSREVNQGGRK